MIIDADRGKQLARLLYDCFSSTGILGNTEMPEDILPAGMAKDSLEHLLFITLTVSIDYQRDANVMWAVSRKTFEDPDTRYLFDPTRVQLFYFLNQALIRGVTQSAVSYLKYMLGPYGAAIGIIELGAKVGTKALSGIRLSPVDFQPGASDLDPATMEYLEKVAAIMKEKKELRLRLCGWATESDRNGQLASAGISPAPSGAGARKNKSGPSEKSVATKDDRLPLGNEEILALAERRADQIEAILVSQQGIKDERIFICKPQIDESPEAKPRVEIVF